MPAWQMATGEDGRWPNVRGADNADFATRLIQKKYVDQVIKALLHNQKNAESFFHVQNMLAHPANLDASRYDDARIGHEA